MHHRLSQRLQAGLDRLVTCSRKWKECARGVRLHRIRVSRMCALLPYSFKNIDDDEKILGHFEQGFSPFGDFFEAILSEGIYFCMVLWLLCNLGTLFWDPWDILDTFVNFLHFWVLCAFFWV